MAYPKKVEDSVLVRWYRETGSVHRTAQKVGLNHSSVHERLCKLGLMKPANLFTQEEEDRLRREYLIYRDAGKLDDLAAAMGRTKPFLCRKARALRMTDYSAPRKYEGSWKHMGQAAARVLMDEFKGDTRTLGQFCRDKGYAEVPFWQTMTKFFPEEWEAVIESKVPPGTTYGVGRGFEHATRNALRRAGYFAMLSPGSRSPIDVVAIKAGTSLFVQCKTSGCLSPAGWNALFDLALSVGAVPVLSYLQDSNIRYRRLTARKDGSKKRQPFAPFNP